MTRRQKREKTKRIKARVKMWVCRMMPSGDVDIRRRRVNYLMQTPRMRPDGAMVWTELIQEAR
jgi:hypothetical protein